MSRDADQKRRQRRLRQIAFISVVLALLLAAWLIRGQFSLRTLLGLDAPGDALTLYALSTLNFIAFVTLGLVLVRHLLKLQRERREGRLGSQFKTRMIVGSIALTFLPTAMLFLFSFWLIDSTLQIFLQPTENVVTSARAILRDYVEIEVRDLHAMARRIVRANDLKGPNVLDEQAISEELTKESRNLRLAAIELRGAGRPIVRVDGVASELAPVFQPELEAARAAVDTGDSYEGHSRNTDGDDAIFIVVGVPIGAKGAEPRGLVLVRRFPPQLAAQFNAIEAQQRSSERLVSEQRSLRTRYVFTLSLVTLIVLFATVWIALFVSRGVTEPIQALVQATGEVASGNLGYRIDCVADGELNTLVASFNAMAAQLGESRQRLVEAALELESSNKTLDERRAYIETVLTSLSTGVVSADASGQVTMVNAAAAHMLGLGAGPYDLETLVSALGPAREKVEALIRRARRSGVASSEMDLTIRDGSTMPAAVTVSTLSDPDGRYAGAVVTVEDLSELIQAERTAAWNEVARRMAHEIKNPLTPIQLSAERIVRALKRDGAVADDKYRLLVEECTATIIREVGALQHMVVEFSRYARMPRPRMEWADLNAIATTAVGLYEGRLNGVALDLSADPAVPVLALDREQIQRVIVNLVDNALEAVAESPERQVTVSTEFDERSDVVRLSVADTGHGIPAALRDRLFLPYFSTSPNGSGLGLSIVSHIVGDHHGRVWCEPNTPGGARFVVELPIQALRADTTGRVVDERNHVRVAT